MRIRRIDEMMVMMRGRMRMVLMIMMGMWMIICFDNHDKTISNCHHDNNDVNQASASNKF